MEIKVKQEQTIMGHIKSGPALHCIIIQAQSTLEELDQDRVQAAKTKII